MGNVLPLIAIYMTYLTIAHNIAWWVAYIHREYQMKKTIIPVRRNRRKYSEDLTTEHTSGRGFGHQRPTLWDLLPFVLYRLLKAFVLWLHWWLKNRNKKHSGFNKCHCLCCKCALLPFVLYRLLKAVVLWLHWWLKNRNKKHSDTEDRMMMLKALTDPRCLLEESGSETEVEIQFCPDCQVLKLFAKPKNKTGEWKSIKKKAELIFKEKNFKQAAVEYKLALESLLGINLTSSFIGDNFDLSSRLKTEAAKICSSLSETYFEQWQKDASCDAISSSMALARRAIDFDSNWADGYLKLAIAYESQRQRTEAINTMVKYTSCEKGKNLDSARPLLKKLQFYKAKEVMQLSACWELLKYPDNVLVVDPYGAGHYTSLVELVADCGKSLNKASILVRPGIYIGTCRLENVAIDIVGDCSVTIDPNHKTIAEDPQVVFRNVKSHGPPVEICPTPFSMLISQMYCTFSFRNCEVSMRRITVEELVKHHPIHAISVTGGRLSLDECSVRSICSASVCITSTANMNTCRFVNCYSAVVLCRKNSTATLKHCFISNTDGIAVESREDAESISLESCTVSKSKKQGLAVYNGAKKVLVNKCVFKANNNGSSSSEGAIQLKNCDARIRDTVIKNQKAFGIVIEDGYGEFFKITIEECLTGFLVQAGVLIKGCTICHCRSAICICESISAPVVLESNTITKCRVEVGRMKNSPEPVLKGRTVPNIITINADKALSGFITKGKMKGRDEKSVGPVSNVAGASDNVGPYKIKKSRQVCSHCGDSNVQLGRKLKTCSLCKKVMYCSKACQVKDWKKHKPICESHPLLDKKFKKAK